METITHIEKRMDELKKKITMLEWDLPRIAKETTRSKREDELRTSKEELKLLQKKFREDT